MPRTDAASRTVAAPAAALYAALVDPERLRQWLPPAGMRGHFEHYDLRPGGSYRMVLTYLDPPPGGAKSSADTDIVDTQILELVEDRRVVWAVDFVSDDPALQGTMTMNWELTALAATSTRVTITAEGVPDGVPASDHRAGLHSSLEHLAQLVEQAGPTP